MRTGQAEDITSINSSKCSSLLKPSVPFTVLIQRALMSMPKSAMYPASGKSAFHRKSVLRPEPFVWSISVVVWISALYCNVARPHFRLLNLTDLLLHRPLDTLCIQLEAILAISFPEQQVVEICILVYISVVLCHSR